MTPKHKPSIIMPIMLCLLVGIMLGIAFGVGTQVMHPDADKRLVAFGVMIFILCCFALDALLNAMRGTHENH